MIRFLTRNGKQDVKPLLIRSNVIYKIDEIIRKIIERLELTFRLLRSRYAGSKLDRLADTSHAFVRSNQFDYLRLMDLLLVLK